MRIQMNDVNFEYSHGKKVLNHINMDLQNSGLICIIGPNGAGKSTLVKCINKLLKPTSGKILIDNIDIDEMNHKEISKHIAYVPVYSEDAFSMNVFETVMIGRYNKQKWKTSKEDIIKTNKILEALDLSEFATRRFSELSAGQHQRVLIARGLIQETNIIILDEPASNLDIKYQIFISEFLHEIAKRKNIMVIMISHNLEITSMFADTVVLMNDSGNIVQIGSAKEVITEKNIYDVYGVRCKIIQHESRPQLLYCHGLD